MTITAFEIGTFGLYIVSVLLVGYLSGRKGKETASDFFLAGRGLPWYVIGFSLIAASISSEQFRDMRRSAPASRWGNGASSG